MKLARAETAEVVTSTVTQFSDELAEKLILTAMETPSIAACAEECGVLARTLRSWLEKGEAGNPRYEYFAAEFERVRGKHRNEKLKEMDRVMMADDPKAFASKQRALEWYLAKFWPKEFASHSYISAMVEQKVDGFDLTGFPQPVLREIMKIMKAIEAQNDGREEDAKRLLEKLSIGKDK